MNNRKALTTDEAVKMLPEKETIKAFRSIDSELFKQELTRAQAINLLCENISEKSGPMVATMGFGISVFDKDGLIIIETK